MPTGKRALRQAVKLAAAGVDVVQRHRPGVVILIYHRVGGASLLDVDQPLDLFDAQMAMLAATRRVVPLGDALGALSGTSVLSEPLIAVTFDDGTADFADFAVPVLVRHHVPVTLYVATAFVDEGKEFPDAGAPVSWAALADACSTGLVDVGSHTHNHTLLDRATEREVEYELDRSRALIEDHLGRAALDFAYPKAVAPAPHADAAVRARFRSAALGGTRANRVGHTDPYRLARSPVQRSDGMTWFRRKANGGMRLEDDLRRALNGKRYAGATT